MCIAVCCGINSCGIVIICCEFIIYTCFSLIHLTLNNDAMREGGCQSHTVTLACVILEPKRVLCRRYILSSVPCVWSMPWEVYWGCMYRIVCGTGSSLRSTLPPRLYLDRDVKVQESSSGSWQKISERLENKADKRRTTRPWRICALSGICFVQLPRSFIDSWLKAVPGLVHEGLSGVSVFRLHLSNVLFLKRGFAIEPLYSIWGEPQVLPFSCEITRLEI